MKSLILFIFLTLIFRSNVVASEMITPDKMFKILSDSPYKYNIEVLKDSIEYDYTDNLNTNLYYLDKEEGSATLKIIDIEQIDKDLYKKAENYFKNNDNEKARETYLELLSKNQNLFLFNTYVGQTYEREKNYDEAIKWYKLSISKNNIDYMAHWFLADNLAIKGEFKDALNSIIYAHLLNRNNPRIILSLKKILKLNNLNYENWVFNPQFKIDSISEKEYSLKIKNFNWLSYANAKTVRTYEPDYNGTNKPINLDELKLEIEAMIGLIYMYEFKTTKDDKKNKDNTNDKADDNDEEAEEYMPIEIEKLFQAAKNEQLHEFVIYESLLPKYPTIIYMLTDDMRESLIEYFMKFKTAKNVKLDDE